MTNGAGATKRNWKSMAVGGALLALAATFLYLSFTEEKGPRGLHAPGSVAPNFDLRIFGGRDRFVLEKMRGKPVVLNFWALYCPPCRREMPDLDALYREFKDRGLQIIGVNTDDPRDRTRLARMKAFIEERKLSFPIVVDYFHAMRLYRVDRIPYTILIDRQGRVVVDFEGPRSRRFFRKHFEKLIGSN
ncbi:MAG: TlpA family protein disulfide reductase [Myxococcales bacterium]|nr:TlpA family protein disulfide reductase [Myxococcales bacterium]